MIDPKELATQFETPGQLAGWLSDFLAALPYSADELAPVVAILGAWQPGSGGSGTATGVSDAMNALHQQETGGAASESVRRIVAGYKPDEWTGAGRR